MISKRIFGGLLGFLILLFAGCHGNLRKSYDFYGLGNNAFTEGKYIDAQNYFTKACATNPKDPDYEHMLGLTIFARGDFDGKGEFLKKAETHLLAAIELYPGFEPPENQEYGRLTLSEARVNLSAVYLEMGRYDEAIAQAQKAAEDPLFRSPDRANYNLGVAYFRKNMPLKAIPYLQISLKQNHQFSGGFKTLGEVYLTVRKYPEAIDSFKQAIALYPKYGEAFYLMGVAYQKQNRRAEAHKVFLQCRDADPQGVFGKKCQGFLH